MANNRTKGSNRQSNNSVRCVTVKALAYRLGVNEPPLRDWLRIRFGRRYKAWLFTEKRAGKIVAEYQNEKRRDAGEDRR